LPESPPEKWRPDPLLRTAFFFHQSGDVIQKVVGRHKINDPQITLLSTLPIQKDHGGHFLDPVLLQQTLP
jgi:hypothetical protein